jgi:hypothetical protein
MTSRYSGAWAKQSTSTLAVPLKPGIDPEHLDPSLHVEEGREPWTDGGKGAPTLPDDLTPYGVDVTLPSGYGPIDGTPNDPSLGVGVGHGQTTEEAQQVRTALMEADYGAVAAHAWNTQVMRDGAPHAQFMPNDDDSQTSAMTGNLRVTGVSVDPQARRGRGRIKRWYDRYIDRHMWDVQNRPMYGRQAYTAQVQPESPDAAPYSSPFPTVVTAAGLNAKQTFVNPQLRRSPDPWDQPLTTDGITPAGSYGLGSWGL